MQVQLGIFETAVLGFLGIIGGGLDIAVLFSSKELATTSWSYHRFIAVVGLIAIPCQTYCGIVPPLPTHQKTAIIQQFLYQITLPTVTLVRKMVDSMVLFMSLERTVALWTPQRFHLVNKPKVFGVLCMISALLGCVAVYDYWTYEVFVDSFGNANPKPTLASASPLYLAAKAVSMNMLLFDALGTFAATIAVIAGMIKRERYRKQLVTADEKAEARRTHQVTLLCLTCSVPMVITWTTYFIWSYFLMWQPSGETALSTMPYDAAMHSLRLLMASRVLPMIFVLTASLEHCGHFYFYYAFNPTFRAKAKELLCCARSNLVEAMQSIASTTPTSKQPINPSQLRSTAL